MGPPPLGPAGSAPTFAALLNISRFLSLSQGARSQTPSAEGPVAVTVNLQKPEQGESLQQVPNQRLLWADV